MLASPQLCPRGRAPLAPPFQMHVACARSPSSCSLLYLVSVKSQSQVPIFRVGALMPLPKPSSSSLRPYPYGFSSPQQVRSDLGVCVCVCWGGGVKQFEKGNAAKSLSQFMGAF
jgi:hypothetical protein